MIVCDICKDPRVLASQCFLVFIKEEEKKTVKRTTEREMSRIPMHLCESCIRPGIARFHKTLAEIRKDYVPPLPKKEKTIGLADGDSPPQEEIRQAEKTRDEILAEKLARSAG